MQIDKQIVIKDSCIIFDLIDLNLIDHFFQLDYIVMTTSLVVNEITDISQLMEVKKYIENGNLIKDQKGQFDSINEIYAECSGLSLPDCSVLELANRENGIILSADKSLRNESERRKIEVHGVLWIVKELISREVISAKQAIEKLSIYTTINERAPQKEIKNLINDIKIEIN